MDLLTQIAKDRLVIMVTHNPELAAEYATRTVNLADGVIRSDTDPYFPTEAEMHASRKPIRKTSMSFLTALALSANNLPDQEGPHHHDGVRRLHRHHRHRGILALANAWTITSSAPRKTPCRCLPLQIMSTDFDMTALMGMAVDGGTGDGGDATGEGAGDDPLAEMGLQRRQERGRERPSRRGQGAETRIVTDMFASLENNDLASLKAVLRRERRRHQQLRELHRVLLQRGAPDLRRQHRGRVRQINPDTTFSAFGMGSGSSNALMSTMYSPPMCSVR